MAVHGACRLRVGLRGVRAAGAASGDQRTGRPDDGRGCGRAGRRRAAREAVERGGRERTSDNSSLWQPTRLLYFASISHNHSHHGISSPPSTRFPAVLESRSDAGRVQRARNSQVKRSKGWMDWSGNTSETGLHHFPNHISLCFEATWLVRGSAGQRPVPMEARVAYRLLCRTRTAHTSRRSPSHAGVEVKHDRLEAGMAPSEWHARAQITRLAVKTLLC